MVELESVSSRLIIAVTDKNTDFIRDLIDTDLASGKYRRVATRFPPHPNGYLHIGHAKSICLNFELARQYNGTCNLRFDDTNPTKEDQEYIDSITEDVHWLGFSSDQPAFFASDYFETMYEIAENLITRGKAFVCSLSEAQTRATRGSLREPGTASVDRNRDISDSLSLFRRMRAGEFPNGAYVLRAKIDMSAANMKMRDPLLYRIRHDHHHRTGDTWPIYPMYDFAHPIEDALEGITHSLCTLEFENNRELYDWVIENSGLPNRPAQTEFARLALTYTITSKRKLLQLVENQQVNGWDDPRMPTIAGMRRRGYRPEAIRQFCDMIGVSKNNSVIDIDKLEFSVRNDLNHIAPRVMAVLRPIKLVISNYPEHKTETISANYFPPEIGKPGQRDVLFSRTLYIERDDFCETPEKNFWRLAPGRWVRLRYAYCIRCDEVLKDESGQVTELRCSYDPTTIGGADPSTEKVWGVIHWVAQENSVPAEVRLFDRLFTCEQPGVNDDFLSHVNPHSLHICDAKIESSIRSDDLGSHVQFERQGYFALDKVDSRPDALIFNRVIGLRSTWTKKNQSTIPQNAPQQAPKSRRAASRPKSRSKADIRNAARKADPILAARYTEYCAKGITESDADLLSGSLAWGERLGALGAAGLGINDSVKWLVHVHPRHQDEPLEFASPISEFVAVVKSSESRISTASAQKLWKDLVITSGSADELIKRHNLEQISDKQSLIPIINNVLASSPDKVAAYRAGKTELLGFFVGNVMRASKGKANAEHVKELLLSMLRPPD